MRNEGDVILAVDPGPTRSAWVRLIAETGGLRGHGITDNDVLLAGLRGDTDLHDTLLAFTDVIVIEKIASFGMSVGAEVFETVYWTGRFAEAARPLPVERLGRLAVKMALCHDSRAKDSNIRAELINRYGPGKDVAIGTKRAPGPLYGVSGDVWSALAVAVAWQGGAR